MVHYIWHFFLTYKTLVMHSLIVKRVMMNSALRCTQRKSAIHKLPNNGNPNYLKSCLQCLSEKFQKTFWEPKVIMNKAVRHYHNHFHISLE